MGDLMQLSDDAVRQFQDLTQANLDSFHILTEVSDLMNDPVISERLSEMAVRRGEFAEELKWHLRENGEEPKSSGTLHGTLRQIWIDFRAAINSGDTYVMLLEAEKAEAAIQAAYEDAIKHLSSSALRSAVSKHVHRITEDARSISGLRENLRHVRRGFRRQKIIPRGVQ